jgi:hypothetical protein
MAREYRNWRYAAEAARYEVCIGYATEEQLYGPLPTFRDWLIDMRGGAA